MSFLRRSSAAETRTAPGGISSGRAVLFVVILGIVSLFSDMTYEGARSIIGPYLGMLGANATIIGVVAGVGEFIGYALRLLSGRLADRTGQYWIVTVFGYCLNLLSVPLLALAGYWQAAVLLMFVERAGKALRSPPRDAMLSFVGKTMGRGWGFAVHEAMDQAGATIGPLALAGILFLQKTPQIADYRFCFGLLSVPALLALITLGTAWALFPRPRELEAATVELDAGGQTGTFWLYLAATGCIAAGFADYPLIAYHFQLRGIVDGSWIPLFYAIAMALDGAAALFFGAVYDRKGMGVIVAAMLTGVIAAPLLFLGGFGAALWGAALWGVAMGAQESVMKAAVAAMSPSDRRGSAFGVFNTCFGVFWLAGSSLMGILYDLSLPAMVAFSVLVQAAGVPLMLLVIRRSKRRREGGGHA
jgi:MFS family permease